MKLFFLLVFFSTHAFSLCQNPQEAEQIARISEMDENSGMDLSRQHTDVFWSLNDSGNSATVYAIDINGRTRGEFNVKGATNVDWEDITVAQCIHKPGTECLYVADIGDNRGRRSSFQVYVIEEPAILSNSTLQVAQKWDFTIPGRLNFEAFSVNEKTGEAYMVSKWEKESKDLPPKVFSLENQGKEITLIGQLNFDQLTQVLSKDDKMVTSSDFDSDSETLLIGTYGKAYEIGLSDLKEFSQKVKIINMPSMDKSESIMYSGTLETLSIMTASEGYNQALYKISCQ